MLYFSEDDSTLRDMPELAGKFDQEGDSAAYERNIAKLARAARRDPTTDGAAWSEAIQRLEEGDHYSLVLSGAARAGTGLTWREAVAVVSVIVGLGAGWAVLSAYFTRDEVGFFMWAAAVTVIVIGSAVSLFRRHARS